MPGWPEELPSLRGPARPRPFVAAGERAAIVGEEASGVRDVLLHPVAAVAGLETGLPSALAVEVSPAGTRRRIPLAEAPALESVLVFRRLPAAVLQWSRSAAGAPEHELRISWRSPAVDAEGIAAAGGIPAEEPVPVEGGALRLPLRGGRGELLFLARPGSARWSVEPPRSRGEEARSVRVGLRAPLRPDEPVTLLATLVRDGGREARTALGRLARLGSELAAWAGASRPGRGRALRIESPEPELDRALTWATARLGGSVIRPQGRGPGRVVAGYGGSGCAGGGGDDRAERAERETEEHPALPPRAGPAEAAWIVHGLVAAGRHDDAVEVVTAGLRRLAPPDAGGSGEGGVDAPAPSPAERALVVHAAARCILWTGDAGPLRDAGEEIGRTLEGLRAAVRPPASAPRLRLVAGAAFDEMADAVEGAGRDGWAGRLRATGREFREQLEDVRPADDAPPEPVAGRAVPPAGILSAVLDVPGPVPPERGRRSTVERRAGVGAWETALRAWAEWERGETDEASGLWSGLLTSGLRAGGMWELGGPEADASASCPWHAATTALTCASLLFGLLGARADAAYGRLRLAPRIPGAWSGLVVSGIRIGDSAVRIAYRRDGTAHTFVFDPLAGRVPVDLVFEPLLPLRSVDAARVDGEPADLEVARSRGRTGIRVQLPLDSRREVTVVGDHAHAT